MPAPPEGETNRPVSAPLGRPIEPRTRRWKSFGARFDQRGQGCLRHCESPSMTADSRSRFAPECAISREVPPQLVLQISLIDPIRIIFLCYRAPGLKVRLRLSKRSKTQCR